MKVDGVPYRSIWYNRDRSVVEIIDQRWLPHEFRTATLRSREDFRLAIADMWVRGAPLIGATAAFGVACDMATDPTDVNLDSVHAELAATRPTAVNLHWALDRCRDALRPLPVGERAEAALTLAMEIADEDVETNRSIGRNGLALIEELAAAKPPGEPVNILTHCNAGWLATVDWGTATSPIYHAHDAGIPVHVWVDETRPRNQGPLTAWEMGRHGVPHTYVIDNAGGHLMQHGLVDLVIVGTDRTTATGDVGNKIGTYLKALAAADNGVPFHVALPSATIDWTVGDGLAEIPIEERNGREVTHLFWGRDDQGRITEVQVTPDGTGVANPAFDVTPARLVTGLITERGLCDASAAGLAGLFPDRAPSAGGEAGRTSRAG